MQTNGAGTTAQQQLLRPRSDHRAVRVLLISVMALVVSVLRVPTALAHTELTGTSPTNGQVVAQSPATLTLSFNEPVGAAAETIQVLTPGGEAAPLDVQALDTTVTLTPVTPLGSGTHTVAWQVTSADGHPISGAFTFSVDAPSASTVSAPKDVAGPQARIAAQTVTYLGVFAAAGLVLFELVFLTTGPGTAPGTRRRLHVVAYLAAATGVMGAVSSALTATQGQGATAPGFFTDPAMVTGLTVAGVLTAVLAAPLATKGGTTALYRAAALGGAGVAGVSLVLTGHTRSTEPGWLVIPADAVHIAAGIIWVGGLLGLVIVLGRASDTPPGQGATTLARFSTAAAWVVTALAVTGLILSWRILGSLGALVTTGYGQMLLIKLALALLVVLVAAWNRFALLPRVLTGNDTGALSDLHSAVQGEAVVLGLILLITGVLTSMSP
ncbi:UNVERIFIED_CONTAM: copper resistance protein CopC [Kocuria sp. CPCC 205316]|uniref:copper resistance CopC/CopD family protein n=1 Tax=Kocuria TaxID=57493 RepID=UPI0036DBA51C